MGRHRGLYAATVRGGSATHQFARDILATALPKTLLGLNVLDVGCREGIMSRALATAGARVVGIDATRTLTVHAKAAERAHPVEVAYRVGGGTALHTVADGSVDAVTAALSLDNIADLDAALGLAERGCCALMDFLPSRCRAPALTPPPPAPRPCRRRTGCGVSSGTASPKGSGDRCARTAFVELAITTAPHRPTSRTVRLRLCNS